MATTTKLAAHWLRQAQACAHILAGADCVKKIKCSPSCAFSFVWCAGIGWSWPHGCCLRCRVYVLSRCDTLLDWSVAFFWLSKCRYAWITLWPLKKLIIIVRPASSHAPVHPTNLLRTAMLHRPTTRPHQLGNCPHPMFKGFNRAGLPRKADRY